MSFYLESDGNSTPIYITNNYLKQKLIDGTSLSVISSEVTSNSYSENINISKHFFERIGVEIPTLSAEKCADIIIDRVSYSNIDDLCAVITLDRVHIIALAYLLYKDAISTSDVLKVIRADSIYTRSSLILQYLAADDQPIDIFAGLRKSMIRYSQKQYATEYHDAVELSDNLNASKQLEIPFAETVNQQFFKSNRVGFSDDGLWNNVDLWGTPNPGHFVDYMFSFWKTNNTFEEWVKKVVNKIADAALYSILSARSPLGWLNYLVEYFGGCTLASTFFERFALICGSGTIKLSIADIMTEFVRNVSVGLSEDKFSHRMDETGYTVDTAYVKNIIQDAFGNAVRRESRKLSFFWKAVCDYKDSEHPAYAYLYTSLIKADFIAWEQEQLLTNIDDPQYKADSSEQANRTAYLFKEHRPFKYFKAYDQGNESDDQLNKLSFTEKSMTTLFSNSTDKYSYPMAFYNVIGDTINEFTMNNSFISFESPSAITSKLNQTTINSIRNMLTADFVVGEPFGCGKFYEIPSLGSGSLGNAIETIIGNAMTPELLALNSSDFDTTSTILNNINNIKDRVIENAFNTRGGVLDVTLPFAYEIVMNYLDFLLLGNAIYDLGITKIDSYIDTDKDIPASSTWNTAWNADFMANVYKPAISNAMFIYYRLIYTIKNSYDLALPALTALKGTNEWIQLNLLAITSDHLAKEVMYDKLT